MKIISHLPERLDTNRIYVDWLCTYFVVIKYPIKYTCNCNNIEEELKNNESGIFITQRANNVLLGLKSKNNTNETKTMSNTPQMKKIQKTSNIVENENHLNKVEKEEKLEVKRNVETNLKIKVGIDVEKNIKDEIATVEAEKEYWNNFFDSNKDILLNFRKIKFKLEHQGWA